MLHLIKLTSVASTCMFKIMKSCVFTSGPLVISHAFSEGQCPQGFRVHGCGSIVSDLEEEAASSLLQFCLSAPAYLFVYAGTSLVKCLIP